MTETKVVQRVKLEDGTIMFNPMTVEGLWNNLVADHEKKLASRARIKAKQGK